MSTMAASAITMAVMTTAVYVILSSQQHRSIDSRLADRIDAVKATLRVVDGRVTKLPTDADTIDDSTWVFDARGRAVAAPLSSARLTSVATSLSSVRQSKTVTINDHVFRADSISLGGTTAVIVAATSSEPYEESRAIAVVALVSLAVVVTAGSAASAAWTVRRTLAPIDQMAEDARDWSARYLDSRFDVVGTDEFTRLGRTLNELLDRVSRALRHEQRLTSELAHELRTPLTAIRGEIELATMAPGPGQAERLERATALVDELSQTVSTLLALAREQDRATTTSTAADIVERVLASWDGSGLTPQVDDPLPGDAIAAPVELAVRALAPLLDNAHQYARTRIGISATAHDRMVSISVLDDGPGISGDDERIFTTGQRSPDSAGAGLGLALARRVARTLGGDVHVESPHDPTIFALVLPRP